jgi:hypothetical protein
MVAPVPFASSVGEQESLVAALLLTGKPVCITGAGRVSILDRLRFVDAVMSMLPYGMRSQMSASTWTNLTAAKHNFRLYFSDVPRDRAKRDLRDHVVDWGRPEPGPIGDRNAEDYLYGLRAVADPPAALARYVDPMNFSPKDLHKAAAIMASRVAAPPSDMGSEAIGSADPGAPVSRFTAPGRSESDSPDLTVETAEDIAKGPDHDPARPPRFLWRRFFYPAPLGGIGVALWIFTPLPSYVAQVIIAVSVTPVAVAVALYLMLTPQQRYRLHQFSRQLS